MNYPPYGFNTIFSKAYKYADGELMEDVLIKQIAGFIVNSPYDAENVLLDSGIKTPHNATTSTLIKLYTENITDESLQKNLALELTKIGSYYNGDGDEIVKAAQDVKSISDSIKGIFGSGGSKKSSAPKGTTLTAEQIQQATRKFNQQKKLADAANRELAAQRAKNTNRTMTYVVLAVVGLSIGAGLFWYIRKNY